MSERLAQSGLSSVAPSRSRRWSPTRRLGRPALVRHGPLAAALEGDRSNCSGGRAARIRRGRAHARYPHFRRSVRTSRPDAVVVLDDVVRDGEADMVERWERETVFRFERRTVEAIALGRDPTRP